MFPRRIMALSETVLEAEGGGFSQGKKVAERNRLGRMRVGRGRISK